ncbi:GNAT family N-acetyltransferase [Actinomyces ruminis]|uniref:GNAT family N-acetyltransferase n=1 Tax=Actinomyces ruminis TaxID=1937003 RepID=A0ABX4MB63_9ACTO|nr:GNAT family N-acetyltransferase [Actinomyces ruminis]PHP52496.1 GNAT family N-acetyltransferase [Actinomyces ruminis]
MSAVPSGVIIRPARPEDAPRVARLLALRGISVEEALEQAPRMIAALPVLLLASLPADDVELAGLDGGASQPPKLDAIDPPVGDDDTAAPIALSGAFLLPGDLEEGRPERWMVSGLIVDPGARSRGIGRALLAAVGVAVQEIEPGEDLFSVVETANHASVAAHLAAGFKEAAHVDGYAGLVFDGDALLMRLPGAADH